MKVEDRLDARLVEELRRDDEAVTNAERAWHEAQSDFEVAKRKYATMRDYVVEHIGFSPYMESVEWGGSVVTQPNSFPSEGRYRFVYMPIGRAVTRALREAGEPMSLDEIVEALTNGGATVQPEALTRAVNASVMRKAGIYKTPDGRYSVSGEEDN